MSENADYLQVNRQNWNKRTELHVKSDFYGLPSFLKGVSSLNDIELKLLGDVRNKSLLHLQCHFGMDTLSLARLNANCTGVDFSTTAIEEAKKINEQIGQDAEFICSDIYELKLDKQFDIVFSSYGVIGWHPDMSKWAKVISSHLKPGGKFVFVEFHPVVWMFDNQFQKIAYNYSKENEIIETETGTYADKTSKAVLKSVTWNHSLSEVIGSLLDAGLSIKDFREYDYSPYDCFEGTEEFEKGKFRIKHLGNKIPMIYSIVAEKK